MYIILCTLIDVVRQWEMAKPKVPTRGGSYLREKDGSLRLLPPEERGQLDGRRSFQEAVDETLADERFGASAVYDRLKDALGCDSDAALAWVLGTSPQGIWNKRNGNRVPFREAVFVSIWTNASLDYLLTGRGKLR